MQKHKGTNSERVPNFQVETRVGSNHMKTPRIVYQRGWRAQPCAPQGCWEKVVTWEPIASAAMASVNLDLMVGKWALNWMSSTLGATVRVTLNLQLFLFNSGTSCNTNSQPPYERDISKQIWKAQSNQECNSIMARFGCEQGPQTVRM